MVNWNFFNSKNYLHSTYLLDFKVKVQVKFTCIFLRITTDIKELRLLEIIFHLLIKVEIKFSVTM